ncbi:hypothetical protein ACTFIW_002738 [Dictyostelium discoideum]
MDDNHVKIKKSPIGIDPKVIDKNKINNNNNKSSSNNIQNSNNTKNATTATISPIIIHVQKEKTINNNNSNNNEDEEDEDEEDEDEEEGDEDDNNKHKNNNVSGKKRPNLDSDSEAMIEFIEIVEVDFESNKRRKIDSKKPWFDPIKMEEYILTQFNFFEIIYRKKIESFGLRLVKEFVRFMIIKCLEKDRSIGETPTKLQASPLIESFWHSLIVDMEKYKIFQKLLPKRFQCNPSITLDPIEVQMERFQKTLQLYDKYFPNCKRDDEMWDFKKKKLILI